ncbi:MAG: Sodium:proton antiporter [uncultured Thiotrichaceae bacterium]|uniref:Sodium:proton antiporter n=1 Tax=uncultured Thiotrichaceae bacterium TaxID=298394 RepID=A0A6S6SDS8_9GAMM|nr:MAG: Sodium:proton antiporter [uncultured Thiotrichaceae bacterium]
MEQVVDILSWLLLLAGSFLGISGAIGLFRFPDFYSRVHAASVTDTLCALLIISGLVLQAGFTLITVKLIIVLLFLWYTSPVASHALVKAAHYHGLKPLLSDSNEDEVKEEEVSSKS